MTPPAAIFVPADSFNQIPIPPPLISRLFPTRCKSFCFGDPKNYDLDISIFAKLLTSAILVSFSQAFSYVSQPLAVARHLFRNFTLGRSPTCPLPRPKQQLINGSHQNFDYSQKSPTPAKLLHFTIENETFSKKSRKVIFRFWQILTSNFGKKYQS